MSEVAILYKFRKPPWGGGNQFLLALKAAFVRRGIGVTDTVGENTCACIFNSHNVDSEYLAGAKERRVRMLHRIDGPVSVYRGKDKHVDDAIFACNKQFADVTVFQSKYSLNKTLELGYTPVNPIIISNAVDYTIFSINNRQEFSTDRKIRLVTTSWSDNVNKGYQFYKWLDENLDWSRFEYTFLGRTPKKFNNIRLLPPVASEGVATVLKSCDIYITASKYESCSNAVLEALSCGIPVLYINSGSHSELVKSGGVCFSDKNELLHKLDSIISNYAEVTRNIEVDNIETVTDRFINALDL